MTGRAVQFVAPYRVDLGDIRLQRAMAVAPDETGELLVRVERPRPGAAGRCLLKGSGR